MLTTVHTLIYSDDAAATRAFLRDVLQWPYVNQDGPGGDPDDWLIFDTGRSELGVHPTSGDEHGGWSTDRHHEIALMCDDIVATVAELTGRGAQFAGDPVDMGFGIGCAVKVPGAPDILIYQAKHLTAHNRT